MPKKGLSKFKCVNTALLYKSCRQCVEFRGRCDYAKVIGFRPEWKRNLCPICVHGMGGELSEECRSCADSEASRRKAEKRKYTF